MCIPAVRDFLETVLEFKIVVQLILTASNGKAIRRVREYGVLCRCLTVLKKLMIPQMSGMASADLYKTTLLLIITKNQFKNKSESTSPHFVLGLAALSLFVFSHISTQQSLHYITTTLRRRNQSHGRCRWPHQRNHRPCHLDRLGSPNRLPPSAQDGQTLQQEQSSSCDPIRNGGATDAMARVRPTEAEPSIVDSVANARILCEYFPTGAGDCYTKDQG